MAILNLKQLQTPKYQSLRVLQASGGWAQVYKDRIREYGKYRTAIIFPEALLFIPSKRIYYVDMKKEETAKIEIGMRHFKGACVWSEGGSLGYNPGDWLPLKTIEEVKDYERENPNPCDEESNFEIFSHHNRYAIRAKNFEMTALFINKKDAMKYVQDNLPNIMDKVR